MLVASCSMTQRVHVVAAVIRNAQQEILLALRPTAKHQGGLWEFPGGKCEADESPQEALSRELCEELGIRIVAPQPLIQVRHDYPDLQVLLDVYEVQSFTGQAHGAEGQQVRWVAAADLANYPFPAANPILNNTRTFNCSAALCRGRAGTRCGLSAYSVARAAAGRGRL